MFKLSTFFILFLSLLSHTHGQGWPKFLGPNGNDIVEEGEKFTSDLSKWSKVWENKIGLGYSAVAVSGNQAFTMGHNNKTKETLHCFDAKTGKTLWTHTYKGALINKLHKGGPNSTPTIEGEFVYILGKGGSAFCLEKASGKVVWQKDLLKEMEIPQPAFGLSSSPVIYKDWVIYSAAKTLVLNKKTGEKVWLSKNTSKEEAAYHSAHATPVIFTKGGVEYITFFVGTGLEILKLADGAFVARHDMKAEYNMTATTPIVMNEGGRIFISWNRYSEMLDFDGKSLKSAWKKKDYTHTMQNSVLIDGVIYGTHGKDRGKRTSFMALDANTGKTIYEKKGFRWSQITVVGTTIFCMNVDGNLVTVKVNPKKFEEVSTLSILSSVCWTKVTYANGRFYCRNDEGRVVCYAVR
ncbi:MAG: PQQ-binding-like beta-propeller repeat protein [Lentisphaeraceae bacterium]|nr:PQQ-binding-like beta-propeller repeat protein [Lentisphaeraceae bacterium]